MDVLLRLATADVRFCWQKILNPFRYAWFDAINGCCVCLIVSVCCQPLYTAGWSLLMAFVKLLVLARIENNNTESQQTAMITTITTTTAMKTKATSATSLSDFNVDVAFTATAILLPMMAIAKGRHTQWHIELNDNGNTIIYTHIFIGWKRKERTSTKPE